MLGAWRAQEESSNLGKGVGRRDPVVGVATAARGGTAVPDCVGRMGSEDKSR